VSVERRISVGPEETIAHARQLAGGLVAGDCVALDGELGAGKTVFVRGLARGLGLADDRLVSSPTYVLVHEYPTDPPLYHLDLYRMSEPAIELADLGLEEMLAEGVVVVEWARRAGGALPARRWGVTLTIEGETRRAIDITPPCDPAACDGSAS
jgi:tRNA threonylcarbamoyl adenosine modification protein YjeE